jgi:hypothetical protein
MKPNCLAAANRLGAHSAREHHFQTNPVRAGRLNMTTKPRAIIIAGPNCAGKTTFARKFLPDEESRPVFVNAGLIAAGLAPFAAPKGRLSNACFNVQ